MQSKFDSNKKILVSYSGGVFKAGNYILEPFKIFMGTNKKLITPKLLPVTGAALFALELSEEKKDKKHDDYNYITNRLQKEENKIKGGQINASN